MGHTLVKNTSQDPNHDPIPYPHPFSRSPLRLSPRGGTQVDPPSRHEEFTRLDSDPDRDRDRRPPQGGLREESDPESRELTFTSRLSTSPPPRHSGRGAPETTRRGSGLRHLEVEPNWNEGRGGTGVETVSDRPSGRLIPGLVADSEGLYRLDQLTLPGGSVLPPDRTPLRRWVPVLDPKPDTKPPPSLPGRGPQPRNPGPVTDTWVTPATRRRRLRSTRVPRRPNK